MLIILRDQERGSRVTLATCADLKSKQWLLREISDESVGMWEPSYDRVLWREANKLHIYLQLVEQADAEGLTDVDATPVSILEYTPD